jgi:hypothetical protein
MPFKWVSLTLPPSSWSHIQTGDCDTNENRVIIINFEFRGGFELHVATLRALKGKYLLIFQSKMFFSVVEEMKGWKLWVIVEGNKVFEMFNVNRLLMYWRWRIYLSRKQEGIFTFDNVKKSQKIFSISCSIYSKFDHFHRRLNWKIQGVYNKGFTTKVSYLSFIPSSSIPSPKFFS